MAFNAKDSKVKKVDNGLDGGSIHLDDRLLCGPGHPRADIGSDRIVVFQDGALFPWKTNLDNVAFGPIVQGTLSRAVARDKARGLLADAGLGGYEDVYPAQTSSGVRRRIEIVRHYFRARRRQLQRDGASDTTSGPGHQRYFRIE